MTAMQHTEEFDDRFRFFSFDLDCANNIMYAMYLGIFQLFLFIMMTSIQGRPLKMKNTA